MKPAIGDRDVKPDNVELAIGDDLDGRAERRVLEIIRRIRDKHRAALEVARRSGQR